MPTSLPVPFRRVVLAFSGLLAVAALVTPRAHAQSTLLVFDTNYTATGLSQWGTSGASGVNYSTSLGVSWSESASFGSFSTGLFGEEWGAGGTASISGSAGFNASFSTNGGSVDIRLPNRISITAPSDVNAATPTISIAQDRSALGSGDFLTSEFPNFSFSVGAHYGVDAQLSGRVAYGFGSTSGTITLDNLFAAAFPHLALANAVTGIDPFHANLNNLLGYNSATSTVTVGNTPVNVSNGVTVPVTSSNIVTVEGGSKVPTQNRLGTVTINPTLDALNAASGSSLSTSLAQNEIIGASIDILGILSYAFGLPVNPFDIRAQIPGTPIDINLMALSLNPEIRLGLKQNLELRPRTYLGLSSNYDVTYQYTDSGGGVHTVTTRDLTFQLPNDGSASSLQIITRPTESDWQLFSRVFVDPQLLNQLFLTIGGGVNIQALRASFTAYGAGSTFGPLLDETLNFGDAEILIYQALFDLEGGTLSRVYRNPIPLFGTGVVRNLVVGSADEIQFFGQSGSFDTSTIDGQLTLRDAGFINTVPLTVNGTLHLDVTSHNGVDLSSNDLRTPQLFLGAGGTVQIDRNSELTVTGLKNTGGADILDAHGNRQVGFITSTGYDAGAINSGTFLLDGTLSYDGPEITSIGSGVHIELRPSGLTNGTDLGRRFNNYHGSSDPAQAVDGLRSLAYNGGTLIVAGQDLALQSGLFTNAGHLAVTNGYDISAPITDFTNQAGGIITVGTGSTMTFETLSASNITAGGILQNMNLNLAGSFSYSGARPNTLAASTSVLLSGARPTGGYLQSTSGDALVNVRLNQGSLRLENGATQSVGGSTELGLDNSDTLTVAGASTLTVNGALTNSGTLTLTNGAALAATGTLANVSASTLTGGTWNLGGTLTYAGSDTISQLGAGTHVSISGAGHGFFNGNGNAFSTLAGLGTGSSLSLLNGATLASSGTLAANGALALGSGAHLTLGGLSAIAHPLDLTGATLTTGSLPLAGSSLSFSGLLTLAGTLNYSGTAITGIASGTTIAVGPGGSFLRHGVNGWATLGTISGHLNLDGGTVRTDASLTLANDPNAVITLAPTGTLQVAGESLTLAPNGTFTQGGTLVLGGGALQTALNLDRDFTFYAGRVDLGAVAVTDNHATTTGTGQLVTTDGFTLTNSATIVGAGDIRGGELVNRGGIHAAGGTLTISDLDSPLLNTGILSSMGTADHPATLVLDGLTVTNSETVGGATTNGTLQAYSTIALRNGTVINGGSVNIFNGGLLESEGATLNVGNLDINGGFLVRNGAQTSLSGAVLVGSNGSLTLETGAGADASATLDFGANSSFTNRGNVTFGAGTRMTNITIQNQGYFNLAAGLTNLNNIVNGPGGTINLLDGSTLELATTQFSNGGLIHLSGEAPANTSHSTFRLTGDLELTGGGTIQLGGYNTSVSATSSVNIASTVWANAGSGTLTGTAGQNYKLTLAGQQLIGHGDFGDGQIWIENQAGSSIGTYGAGSLLTIATTAYNSATGTGGLLNLGTLNVGPGSTMHIEGDFRSLDASGNLALGAYRVGGTLKIDGLGHATAFDNEVALTFDGDAALIANLDGTKMHLLTNTAAAALTVTNGTYTVATAGTSFTNEGLLRAGAGGTLALTGGNFTNFSNQTLTRGSYDTVGTIRFDGADVVTLADASLTLRGNGTVTNATGAYALAGFANLTNSSLFLRDGATLTVNAGTFTNTGGRVYVSANSRLAIDSASFVHATGSGGSVPNYWIAGNIHVPTNNQAPGETHFTFYGPGARLNFTDQFLPGSGHLTLAGGATATYAAGTVLTNQGLWEIGSSTALGPDGAVLRSAAQVTFAGTAASPVTINNVGTMRYYGGGTGFGDQAVDDGTQSRFTADHLRITGSGTFDASGSILINAGGTFEMNGVLANSEGDLDIIFASGANVFKLTGGLDLSHDLDIFRGTLDFTHLAGYRMGVSGFTFSQAGLSFGPTTSSDLRLRNGGLLVNSTTGRSAIENIALNRHTLTFADATGVVSDGNNGTIDYTFLPDFTNQGIIDISGTGILGNTVFFAGDLTNQGTITGGGVYVAGDFYNAPFGSPLEHPEGHFSGSLSVVGNATNGANGTMTNLSGSVGGIFSNAGTVLDAGSLRIGGYVSNHGTMAISTTSFKTPDQAGWAAVFNYGTLHTTGYIENALGGDGTVHTTAATEFLGNNEHLTGNVVVDSGSLTIREADQLGGPAGNGTYGHVTLTDNTTLNLGASVNQTFTLGHNATLAGLGANGGAIAGSVGATGSVNLTGRFSLGAFHGAALNLGSVSSPASLTLVQGGSLSGDLGGYGTVAITGISNLTLNAGSTLVGAITLQNALGSLTVRGDSFTPNVTSVGISLFFYGGNTLAYHGGIDGTTGVRIGQNTALTFDHQQAYTGTTTIDAGSSLTLADGTGGVINFPQNLSFAAGGGVAGPIANAGALILAGNANHTLGTATVNNLLGQPTHYHYGISGNGTITKTGTGITTATDASFLDHLTIDAGVFKMGDGATSLDGTLPTATNHSVLAFHGTGNATATVNGPGRIDTLGAANYALTLNGASGLKHYGTGTVTLAANQNTSGQIYVGGADTIYGSASNGGGTLQISSDSALGLAPATFTAGQLTLGYNSRLSIWGDVTLAATRGLAISGATTIDTLFSNTSFVIPTAIATDNASLTKTGFGTLDMLIAPTAYNVQQGTLLLRNSGTDTKGLGDFIIAENATARLSGTGNTNLAAGASILGTLIVDADNHVTINSGIAGSVTLDGSLSSQGGAVTLNRVTGTGTFTRLGAWDTTTTVDTLAAGTVNVDTGTLHVASYDADATNIRTLGAILSIGTGQTRALTLSNNTTLDVSGNFTINGPISPYAFTLTKNGLGNLTFTDAGNVQTNFVLNKNVDISGVASGGNLASGGGTTFHGVISGASGFSIFDNAYANEFVAGNTAATPNAVRLVNKNTYTGGTGINVGELILGNGATAGSVVGDITLNTSLAGALFDRSDVYTLANPITGNGYFGQTGAGTLVLDSWINGRDPADAGEGEVAPLFTGQLRVNTGTVRLDDGANGYGASIAVASGATLALNSATTQTVDATITSTGTVAHTGAGTTTLTAENTLAQLNVTTGEVALTAANTITNTTIANGATLALTDGVVVHGAQRNGAVIGTIANSGTLAIERSDTYVTGFTATGTGRLEHNGTGTTYLTGATQTNHLVVNAGALSVTEAIGESVAINGLVTVAAGTSFIHTGRGTLSLNNGSTGAGQIVADDGVTRLAGGSFDTNFSVSAGALLEVAQDIAYAHTITGANGQLAIADGNTLSLLGSIALGTTTVHSGATLGLHEGSSLTGLVVNHGLIDFNFANDATFSNVISGTGTFLQDGLGKVTITGVNTATGGATIASGSTLALAGAGSIGGTITNDGVLEIVTNPGDTRLIPGNIAGDGTLNLSGTGTIEVAGDLSYAGLTTLSDGVTLNVNTNGTSSFNSMITGTGNLIKAGTGTLVVNASSTLNGDVTISNGTLQIGNGGNTGYLVANNILNHGTLAYNLGLGNDITLDSISGQGGIRQMGAGGLRIIGNNPGLVGDTTVDATRILTIGNVDGSAGSVGGQLVVNGTLFYDRTGDITLTNAISGAGTGALYFGYGGNVTLDGGLAHSGLLSLAGRHLTVNSPFNSNSYLGTIAAASLTVGNGRALAIVGDNTSGMAVTNGGTLTIGNGATSGSLGGTIANNGILIFNRSDDFIAGADSGHAITGLGVFRQSGSGIVTVGTHLSAADFSATNGTLRFTDPTANLGTELAPVYASIGSTDPGTLRFDAGTFANHVTGTGALSTVFDVTLSNTNNNYNRAIHLGTAGYGLTLASATNDLAIGGTLSGAGNLIFNGTGTLSVASSTTTGTIRTAGATVVSAGDLASTVEFLNTAGFVELINANAATLSGAFTNAAGLKLSGAGTVTLDTNLGALSVAVLNGSLLLGTNGSLTQLSLANDTSADFGNHAVTLTSLGGSGSLALGTSSLTFDQAFGTTSTFAGSISGTGGIVTSGSGEVALTGITTFTGGIDVQGAALTLGASGSFSGLALNSTRLNALDGVTFAAHQAITLAGGGVINSTGVVTLNSDVTGTGDLTLNGSGITVLGGQVLSSGNLIVDGGTLRLGRVDAIDAVTTIFRPESTFDLNGFDWHQALDVRQAVVHGRIDSTVANHGTNAVTLSSAVAATNGLGLDGGAHGLTFTGTIASPGSVALPLYTNGLVALGTASAAGFNDVRVLGGVLDAPIAAMTALTSLRVQNAGRFNLTGTVIDPLTLGAVELIGGNAGLHNQTGGDVSLNTALTLTANNGFDETALIGGDHDLTLTGSFDGQLSLTKVGSGNLTLTDVTVGGWSNANDGARLGVREGTLTTSLTVLNNRALLIEDSGTLILTGDPYSPLALRSLSGNGSLDLGDRSLDVNLTNTGLFTGTLTTTGSVTHNAANDTSFGSSGGTQTYGTLTASSLTLNAGDVVVTDAFNVDNVTVIASGGAGSLTTTLTGISSANGTILDAPFYNIQGEVHLTGGAGLTGNAGNVTLYGPSASLTDENNQAVRFATNSGYLTAAYGAQLSLASTFTNTRNVSVFGGSYIDGLEVLNQAAGEFDHGGGYLGLSRVNLTGGELKIQGGSYVQSFGSTTALSNPVLVMTGGTLSGSGMILGGAEITGGTVSPGGNYVVGSMRIGSGAVFAGGGRLAWDINDANGTSGVNYDLLEVTGSATSGKITVTATAADPFIIDPRSTTGGNVPNFDGNANYVWTMAKTDGGFTDFASDKFVVDAYDFANTATGNFGVSTALIAGEFGNEHHLQLNYQWSHVFTNAGTETVATALAANGQFGGLRKTGAGTLVLAGDNLFTGQTHIHEGTLQIGDVGATGQVLGNIANHTALVFNRNNALTHAGVITGAGIVTQSGTGTLTLAGVNTYTGGTVLQAGRLAVAADTALGAAAGSVTFDGGTLVTTDSFSGNRATTLAAGGGAFDTATGTILGWNGGITGTGDLTKLGLGTLVLGGTNTYSGDTFVNAGTLRLGLATALSPNTTLNVATDATFDANGFAQTFNSLGGTGSVDVGSAGIAVAPTGTNTFAGTLAGTGGLTLAGPGTLVLNNANAFTGATTVTQGTLRLGATGALPTGTAVSLGSGTTLDLNGHAASVAKLEGAGNLALGNASLAIIQSADATFAGSITGTGGLAKSGAGRLTLNGNHTFTGTTAITGGQLTLNGSAANSAFTVAGGTLGGNGTVGALTLASGGLLAPGNSPGTLNAGNTTFGAGGSFQFEINDATGSAGTAYDLLAISGSLAITATSGSPFTLDVTSLTLANTAGLTANFDSAADYAFTFVTTTTGITGFSADKFAISTTAFTNPFNGSWSVGLTNGGNDLALNYTGASAIPEPSTYAAIFGACALALASWRKRRRK